MSLAAAANSRQSIPGGQFGMTVSDTEFSAPNLLADLRARYPKAPFLALGQTVFWDEPMKAVLRCLLDENYLGGEMFIGVHDTDYFAKTPVKRPGQGRFALMAHNDGTTKNLWSAAGEISTLFGSETFPSRSAMVRCGAAFERLAADSANGRQAFLDEVTEAWGWRGLVYTGSSDRIVNSLPLREVGPGMLELLEWGFDQAVRQIAPLCCQYEAKGVAERIRSWCRDFVEANPDRCLTDLFTHCLPMLYQMLIGRTPTDVTVGSTTELLRFAPATAALPRFRFVDLFLNPATRQVAIDAYNQAVFGSEIYTLDKFGPGALPFDVLIPDRGRGTLRVTDRVLFVETRRPVAIALKRPIESVHDLAEALSRKLGDGITLVGKAVSLVSMLAQEFIFVFNEEGSLYVRRTRQMNDALRRAGIELDMRPILRMRYRTWDALVSGQSTLDLPDHLAAAFGRRTITAPEFANSWRQVVEEQQTLCDRIATIHKPLALLDFLEQRDPLGEWDVRRAAYLDAKANLLRASALAAEIQAQIRSGYDRLKALRAQLVQIQQERGRHFRSVQDWTPDQQARRVSFADQLEQVEREKQALIMQIRAWKQDRLAIERGPEAAAARRVLAETEVAAETARLYIIRAALLTIEGLPHTNHRPSAWWLPMIDKTGRVFRNIVETTEIYTEPLLS